LIVEPRNIEIDRDEAAVPERAEGVRSATEVREIEREVVWPAVVAIAWMMPPPPGSVGPKAACHAPSVGPPPASWVVTKVKLASFTWVHPVTSPVSKLPLVTSFGPANGMAPMGLIAAACRLRQEPSGRSARRAKLASQCSPI
jgi:hypothetical protein